MDEELSRLWSKVARSKRLGQMLCQENQDIALIFQEHVNRREMLVDGCEVYSRTPSNRCDTALRDIPESVIRSMLTVSLCDHKELYSLELLYRALF
jgi:hypothetical protein